MGDNKTTFTREDTKSLFYLLYKLENHFEERTMRDKEQEITVIIRKLNDIGIRE